MARTTSSGRATGLRDVAAQAGVSVSTVSRYLNGQLRLKHETEERILAVLDRVGYPQAADDRGRRAARGQATPTSEVIGLIIPRVGHSYFSGIADAVVDAAERRGYTTLIASTQNDPRRQLDHIGALTARGIAGLVYAGGFAANHALAEVIEGGLPVVVVDEDLAGLPPVDRVVVDDYSGAYQATTHLSTLGHTRIALVAGPATLRSVHERSRGFRDALARTGGDPDAQIRLHGTFTEEFGAAALAHLLASAEPPTAVFAASDPIALGAMASARTLGVTVPDDMSIVGFDDIPPARLVTPRLTTMRTPLHQMADAAIAMLGRRIADPTREPCTAVTPVSLVVGGTAGPPP